MPQNNQESPLLNLANASENRQSLFAELNAISEEIERCRSIAQS